MPWLNPKPGRADLKSELLSRRRASPAAGTVGFDGPVVPSLMIGAEKLILGIFAPGEKFGGKPAGRPDCCEFGCKPGGSATPGADIPGAAGAC